MQLFKMKKNTTNSAKIVIETSGLFLYCFFSSNHRPPKVEFFVEKIIILQHKKNFYPFCQCFCFVRATLGNKVNSQIFSDF